MDVLQDLLEDLAVTRRRGAAALQITEVGELAARPDRLQICSAAEDAGGAAEDDHAHGGVASEEEPGLAKVASRRDVERIEPVGAIDREESDAALAFDADVRHGCAAMARAGVRSSARPAFEHTSAIAPVRRGPHAVASIHSSWA